MGALIALAISTTGIGGGILTAPVLMLYAGLPPVQAVGTALVFVTAVKLCAAPAYMLREKLDYRVLAWLAAGGVPGVVVGTALLRKLDLEGARGTVLVLVGITVVVCAALHLVRRSSAGAAPANAYKPARLAPIAAAIGVEVGFSSAGAGALGTLALMRYTNLKAAQVVGTDLLFGLVLSAAGGALHLISGDLNQGVLLHLLTGGIPGALAGVWVATVVPSQILRKALSVWLIVMGGHLLSQGISSLR